MPGVAEPVSSTAAPTTAEERTARRVAYRDELLGAGVLVDLGSPGLYARGAVFERVLAGVRHAVEVAGVVDGDDVLVRRFPPVFPFAAYERTDYVASFPDLTGLVRTFTGGDREHRALLADREAGLPWDHHLGPGETVLVSAACHPLYATLAHEPLPPQGVVVDLETWCFRHEPSPDPFRQQAFTMHERVTVGTPQQAQDHRDRWLDAGLAMLRGLGLPVEAVPANDPFFGRAGRLLANSQLEEELKIELVVPAYGDPQDVTALLSVNSARDHFGLPFGIRTADGEVAHSACTGIGVDRITLALLRHHGLDPDTWPADVRAALGETVATVATDAPTDRAGG